MTAAGRRVGVALAVVMCAGLLSGRTAAQPVSIVTLLDRYAAGQFDAVVSDLGSDLDFSDLLDQLKRDGPAWIDALGPEMRARRELVAATVALEAARADEWHDWKWIWKPPRMEVAGADGSYQPPSILYWRPAPLFIEWACARLRGDPTPRPIERWWQLAALAVAQRSEDLHFLVGDPNIGRGFDMGEIGNLKDEIKHLDHVSDRFPGERRFMLAQGIAREKPWPTEGMQAYNAVAGDIDAGGEAVMRLGALMMRQGKVDDAFDQFDRAEDLTRDPYVVYLARFFRGQLAERQRRVGDATDAYRGAVAAWPHGQAATMSLASLLFDAGRRADAHEVTGAMLAARPPATDPWRGFIHADDRFWPLLVGRLRAEIRR